MKKCKHINVVYPPELNEFSVPYSKVKSYKGATIIKHTTALISICVKCDSEINEIATVIVKGI